MHEHQSKNIAYRRIGACAEQHTNMHKPFVHVASYARGKVSVRSALMRELLCPAETVLSLPPLRNFAAVLQVPPLQHAQAVLRFARWL